MENEMLMEQLLWELSERVICEQKNDKKYEKK